MDACVQWVGARCSVAQATDEGRVPYVRSRRAVVPEVRCSLLVALADLAVRFPNVVEPWTPRLYVPLRDPELGERGWGPRAWGMGASGGALDAAPLRAPEGL